MIEIRRVRFLDKDGGPITAFDQTLIDAISATTRDAAGAVLGHGVNASLPYPGMPTDTGSDPLP